MGNFTAICPAVTEGGALGSSKPARTISKALYWAGIEQDEWFNLAESRLFWGKLTHGEWNGSAGRYEQEREEELGVRDTPE